MSPGSQDGAISKPWPVILLVKELIRTTCIVSLQF